MNRIFIPRAYELCPEEDDEEEEEEETAREREGGERVEGGEGGSQEDSGGEDAGGSPLRRLQPPAAPDPAPALWTNNTTWHVCTLAHTYNAFTRFRNPRVTYYWLEEVIKVNVKVNFVLW